MKELEKALIELGKDSPFYLYILLGMRRVETDTVRTVSLGFNRNGDVILFYNPKIGQKGVRFIKALLKHEVMHLINQHFLIRPKDNRDKKIWDLAMDAAINQYIEELDAFGVSLNQLIEEGHGVDNEYIFAVPPPQHPDETAEFYHEWILKKFEELGRFDIDALPSSPDDHSISDDVNMDMILEITKSRVGKAFNIYGGSLPSGVQRMVEKILSRPTLNWRILVRRFMGVSVRGERYTTPMRPNRRYDDQPGWRHEYRSKIAIVLDTSGSIIFD
jgi:predicted metal-dependent peptidase